VLHRPAHPDEKERLAKFTYPSLHNKTCRESSQICPHWRVCVINATAVPLKTTAALYSSGRWWRTSCIGNVEY